MSAPYCVLIRGGEDDDVTTCGPFDKDEADVAAERVRASGFPDIRRVDVLPLEPMPAA